MDLSNYRSMDPHLLVGVVNTAIRNHCEDLEDLCKVHDIDQVVLVERLSKAGYDYLQDQKQFR